MPRRSLLGAFVEQFRNEGGLEVLAHVAKASICASSLDVEGFYKHALRYPHALP